MPDTARGHNCNREVTLDIGQHSLCTRYASVWREFEAHIFFIFFAGERGAGVVEMFIDVHWICIENALKEAVTHMSVFLSFFSFFLYWQVCIVTEQG